MAITWNKIIPRWGGTTIEPPEAKKDTGYIAGDKPPAKWENWLRKGTYEALDETRDVIEGIDSQLTKKVNKSGDTMTGNLNVPTINNIDVVENRTKRIPGLHQKWDCRKTIIALCNLSVADSFSDGTITLRRSNGLYGIMSLDVNFEKTHNLEAAWYSVIVRGVKPVLLKPCVFSYNGVKYAGIEFMIDSPQATEVEFNGATNFDIFSIDYWNAQTDTALNSEIANSINYTDVYPRDYLSFNLKDIAIYSRGSNANGEWIRFEDGTQICTHRINASATANTAGNTIWTFPVSFVGDDMRQSANVSNNSKTWLFDIALLAMSANTQNISANVRYKFSITQTYVIDLFTIGRWK